MSHIITISSPSYAPYVKQNAEGQSEIYFTIDGVHCAGCILNIESHIKSDKEIKTARLNFSTRRLHLVWDGAANKADDIAAKITALGYGVSVYEQGSRSGAEEEEYLLHCLAVAGFASSAVMMFSVPLWAGDIQGMGEFTRDLLHLFSALVVLPSVLYAGRPFYTSAFATLRSGRTNMDVPITVGVFLSCVMSVYQVWNHAEYAYFDAAIMLVFFLLIGRYLDTRARGQARAYATDLLAMMGGTAQIEDGARGMTAIPARDLKPGMILCVAAGEKIAADGVILSGSSQIDTSLITGETLPRDATVGTDVFAGTMNLDSPLRVRVGSPQDHSILSEIIRLMEQAEQGQAKYVRLSDRVARAYTPVVHILALATFAGWMGWGGTPWDMAAMHGLAVLIITCPCALGLAVPVVQVLATSTLMQKGILVKAGDAYERIASADTIVFDKTGTLTMGRPALQNGDCLAPDALQVAASLASHSRHPISKALTAAYKGDILDLQVEDHKGMGLSATVQGVEWRLGRAAWACPDKPINHDETEDAGASLSVVLSSADGSRGPAVFYFADDMRPDAAAVITDLQHKGYALYVLSGDRPAAVRAITDRLGFDSSHVHAGMTPPEKTAFLTDLMARGARPIMVGDGLNDAPSLMAATASLSPSSAIDITQNAADLVFTGDSLRAVPRALITAKATQKLVRQNLGLALLYNAIAIPIAMAGFVTPMIAAIAMSGSSLMVVGNAFRLRRLRLEGE